MHEARFSLSNRGGSSWGERHYSLTVTEPDLAEKWLHRQVVTFANLQFNLVMKIKPGGYKNDNWQRVAGVLRQPYTPPPGPLSAFQPRDRLYFETIANCRGDVPVYSGESHAETVAKVIKHFETYQPMSRSAAHAVALGLRGHDYAYAARRAVHTALSLANRDQAAFLSCPVRGNLRYVVDVEALQFANPAIAVNLSALRALEWHGALTAGDLLLLWILIGFAASGETAPEVSDIGRRFGLSRPERHVAALREATFSLTGDSAVAKSRWAVARPILDPGCDSLNVTDELLSLIVPLERGENYAYVDLLAVAAMSKSWHERAYRSLLAAAVRSKTFWAGGGAFSWTLSLADIGVLAGNATLTSKSALALLRTWQDCLSRVRRPKPNSRSRSNAKKKVAFIVGARVTAPSIYSERAETGTGRAVVSYVVDGKVAAADWREMPKRGIAYLRTEERLREPTSEFYLPAVSGLGLAPSSLEIAKKRSEAARRGWRSRWEKEARKRSVAENVAADAAEGTTLAGIDVEGLIDTIRFGKPGVLRPKKPTAAELEDAIAALEAGAHHSTVAQANQAGELDYESDRATDDVASLQDPNGFIYDNDAYSTLDCDPAE